MFTKKYNANFREKALTIYDQILENKAANRKMFALLIDPEKASDEWLCQIMSIVNSRLSTTNSQQPTTLSPAGTTDYRQGCKPLVGDITTQNPVGVKENNYTTKNSQFSILNSQLVIFVGGSQLKASIYNTVERIKQLTSLPVVMFPGDASQFADNVDALLFLSLASGRNAKYLIEQHIKAAPSIKKANIETIPTGYILVDGKKDTAVARVSHTEPYPVEDVNLITDTALACQLLGHKMVYLEAGSGANRPVPQHIIAATRQSIDIPLIVGGGIKTPEQMMDAFRAGADLVVVGNHIESHPDTLASLLNQL